MTVWALKDCLNFIAEQMTFLIIAFLDAEKLSSHLERAQIVPIIRNGNTEKPSNARPISKTSALSKKPKKVLKGQTDDLIEKNYFLCPLQFGFCRGFSTTDALLYATE